MIKKLYRYFYKVFAAISMLLNVVCGGRMYETVCARAWRVYWTSKDDSIAELWASITISITNIFDKYHCKKAATVHQRIRSNVRDIKVD